MKRLIVCCDGTWQKLSSSCATNVVKLTQIIKPTDRNGIQQIVYYQEGIGTRNKLDSFFGGNFGWGIDKNIQDAYRFLALNYEDQDEIYLFGFSRGAYTVRSLAGFIYCSGLLSREKIRELPDAFKLYRNPNLPPSSSEARKYRQEKGESVPIKLLACWDTVGALGIPSTIPVISQWLNAKYKFHDTQVNRKIANALHAVAVDERRSVFNVTPMRITADAPTTLHQVWFPGDHSSVGGGDKNTTRLADTALLWMVQEVQKLGGLEFVENPEAVADGGIAPNYKIPFDNRVTGIQRLLGAIDRNIVNPDHNSTDQTVFDENFFDRNIHESVKQRWKAMLNPEYRPANLLPYRQYFDTI